MLNDFVTIAVLFIACLHASFAYMEMFLWTKPFGLRTFKLTAEQAFFTKQLAFNQGIYNGFLCAGLIWSLLSPIPYDAYRLQGFFLSCIVIAGIAGGFSVNKRIFYIQGLPALITLTACFIAYNG